MTPSRGAPSVNIITLLCAKGAPSSGSSLLTMRPSEASPLGILSTDPFEGKTRGASGSELNSSSVECATSAPFTKASPKQSTHQNQASPRGSQALTAKDTTAPNSAPQESTNRGAAFPFSGTHSQISNSSLGSPTASPCGADESPSQRTQAKNEGTNAAATTPSTSPSSSSSAPNCIAAQSAAAPPSLPRKCSPMLTISSALCNDNFTDRRNRGRTPSSAHNQETDRNFAKNKNAKDQGSGSNNGKARYHERFAPLRPTDRGQIEELQRRRREQEKRSSGVVLRQPHTEAASARPSTAPAVEPPSWAVPAPGEAKLEPVCESLGVQDPVDLTSRPCFRVGRCPGSDVQLLHATSSRRHALLFHHPNGSCYVVDCGSAHGTYVNGVRVPSATSINGGGTSGTSMIVPHRVKRGALVRFGGPGAPSFMLKSFSIGFESLVKDLPGVDTESSDGESSSTEESMDELLSGFPSPSKLSEKLEGVSTEKSHRGLRRVVSKEGEDGAPMDSPSTSNSPMTSLSANLAQSEAALVQLNTRLNAVGGTSHLPAAGRRLAHRASSQLSKALRVRFNTCATQKRPTMSEPEEQSSAKRLRTEGTSLTLPNLTLPQSQMHAAEQEHVLSPMATLVSPVAPLSSKLLLSPDVGCAPPLPPLHSLAPTPVPTLQDTLTLASNEVFQAVHKRLLIPSGGDLKGPCGSASRRPILARKTSSLAVPAPTRRRVRFSDDAPQMFYPPSVTPDELSSDEGEDNHSFALAPTPPTTPRAMLAGL
mmetsp:Transcript_7684/g.22569  ORF Transcript_7684/g.22569 Transcript_7684/m.22569 type:complete len:765 (-) Transcript_7684:544-2838(-)